jgi:tetratricopeptide (TPR) repeat protein
MKKFLLVITIFFGYRCLVGAIFFHQQESGYTWENIFSIPTQVQNIGLGNVNNSVLKNYNCININPATMYDIYYKEVSVLFSPIVSDSEFSLINYSMPVEIKNLRIPVGVQITRIISGDAERFNSFGESYGYKFNEKFLYNTIAFGYYLKNYDMNLGLGIKNVYQTIDDYNVYGNNLDLGIIFPCSGKHIVGISWLNVFPTKFGKDEVASVLRTGSSFELVKMWFSKIIFSTELDFVNIYNFEYLSLRWGVAGKIDFFKLPITISVTAGYYGIGCGINIFNDEINFGYGIIYNLLGYNHRFGLSYKFNFYPEENILRIQDMKTSLEQQKIDYIKTLEQEKIIAQKVKQESLVQQKIVLKLLSAKDFYEKKEYLKTKNVLLEILKLDPQNESAKEMLKSVDFYLDKNVVQNLLSEAKILYDKNKYDESIIKLTKVLDFDPENLSAKILLKLCSAQKNIFLKKFNEAKSDLFEVLRLDLNNEQATELLKKVETLIELAQ